jgi:hypothetical protein
MKRPVQSKSVVIKMCQGDIHKKRQNRCRNLSYLLLNTLLYFYKTYDFNKRERLQQDLGFNFFLLRYQNGMIRLKELLHCHGIRRFNY